MNKNVDLLSRYNYDEFTANKVLHWLNFENSPSLGNKAPTFPLWHIDGTKTDLSAIWSKHLYTIVEFGSFT